MLHQDGSRHVWLQGQPALDLIVTLDDATSEIYSAFLVGEEGTASTFRALAEVFTARGLPMSLYTDRGSHYFLTPEAGGGVDRGTLTQVGRALAQLGVEHIAAYSPQARGRSERMFQTLQDRLVKELALAGITTVEAANVFLREVYLPAHNARFAVKPAGEGLRLRQASGHRHHRKSLPSGKPPGWQRQLRELPPAQTADPGKPAQGPLRQGKCRSAPLSRRSARHLPRAALPRPLRPERRDQNRKTCGLTPLGRRPVEMWTRQERALTTVPQDNINRKKRTYDVLPKPDKLISYRHPKMY